MRIGFNWLVIFSLCVLPIPGAPAEESALALSRIIPIELDGYPVAPPGLAFGEQWRYQFPEDYAAHDAYRAELWQWYVQVADSSGQQLGVGGRMLRFAVAPQSTINQHQSPWHFSDVFVSSRVIVDYQQERAAFQQTLSRSALDLAGTAQQPSRVWVRAQQLRFDGRDECALTISVDAVIEGLPVELELRSSRCAVPGSVFEAASVFGYTQSINEVDGTLGKRKIVSGSGWLDRAWGELPLGQFGGSVSRERSRESGGGPAGEQAGSGQRKAVPAQGEPAAGVSVVAAQSPVVADQFRLRLSETEQIIILQTRRRSGKGQPRWSAYRLSEDTVTLETLDDIEVESLSSWTSPESDRRYASGWRIALKPKGSPPRQWLLTPVALDQESRQYGETRWIGFARVEYLGVPLPDAFAVVDLAPAS